eukprot:ANDGO_07331.mRNA.1 Tetraketide alpha-pyrone reductase 2
MHLSTVAVTGGTGFIASHLIKALLESGLTVHATVRSLHCAQDTMESSDTSSRVSVLQSLFSNYLQTQKLVLFEAPLIGPSSEECVRRFRMAFEGCDGVFHTASPFFTGKDGLKVNLDPEVAQKELIDPAVMGTRHVLQACCDVRCRRVVLTSSNAAIQGREAPSQISDSILEEKDLSSEEIKYLNSSFSEKDWSDPVLLKEKKLWYALSKTLAERTALDEFSDHLDIRVVNPTLVLGPLLTKHLNQSHKRILEIFDGTWKEVANATFGVVHIADVVEAHVLCMTTESADARGRHLCLGCALHWKDICDALAEVLKELGYADFVSMPPNLTPAQNLEKPKQFDVRKTERLLGHPFKGLKETLKDSVQAMVEQGLWKPTK